MGSLKFDYSNESTPDGYVRCPWCGTLVDSPCIERKEFCINNLKRIL